MEKYSVLMSLYKKEKPEFLIDSIESILNQSVPPDEIVIVRDGPLTNELEAVLNKYCAKYPDIFNIVTSVENIGLGLALNLGLSSCRNELVARMDTDDISLPKRCEYQLKEFEKDNDLDIVGTMIDEFHDDPNEIVASRIVPTTHYEIYKFAKRRSAFNHPSVMYKKSKVLECGGYANLRRNQDVELFGRMLFLGAKAKNINESLLLFRSNRDLAKRRKSWENTSSYISTIYKFWRMGFSSIWDLFIVSIGQIIIFLCPVIVQSWLYALFLRRKRG